MRLHGQCCRAEIPFQEWLASVYHRYIFAATALAQLIYIAQFIEDDRALSGFLILRMLRDIDRDALRYETFILILSICAHQRR